MGSLPAYLLRSFQTSPACQGNVGYALFERLPLLAVMRCEWKLRHRSLTQSHPIYTHKPSKSSKICVYVGVCTRLSYKRLWHSMRNLKLLPKLVAIFGPNRDERNNSSAEWKWGSERLRIKERKEGRKGSERRKEWRWRGDAVKQKKCMDSTQLSKK